MKKSIRGKVGKDLHLLLSEEEARHLAEIARDKGITQAAAVREALTVYRASERKARVEAAMREDVEKNGKYSLELTKEFEPHVMEMLSRETEW